MEITSISRGFSGLSAATALQERKVSGHVAALSSGNRIARAADDVASLSVSVKMRSRIQALQSIATNVAQASSLLQVADDGLQQIDSVLQRMNSLAVMANSGTASAQDRVFLDQEFSALYEEIDRLAAVTEFNGINVLSGAIEETITITEEVPIAPTVAGDTITGGVNIDVIDGTANNDDITAFDGDDVINAGAGNDVINPGVDLQPGLIGSVYLSGGGIGNLAAAEAVVAGAGAPSATFTATSLDYPNGAVNTGGGNINAFLGVDAASLSNAAVGTAAVNRVVFVFEGFIDIPADGNYTFGVGSDDGFNLQIDGNTIIQFPNNRGFNFTNGNANLTEGLQSFRLIFWENGGGNGVEAISSLVPGGNLDTTVLSAALSVTDGNDNIDGGDGSDIVVYDGNAADYTVTDNGDGSFTVQDNRADSPNGTDILRNVEIIRFADEDSMIGSVEPEFVTTTQTNLIDTLTFAVNELDATSTFDYDIVDARTSALFMDGDSMNIQTQAAAAEAIAKVEQAIDAVTERRAYVGSLQSQADVIGNSVFDRLRNQRAANGVIADTDITRSSTDYAKDLAKHTLSITMQSQAENLRRTVLTSIYNELGGTV